jgi:CheY-like chemotaxis protein
MPAVLDSRLCLSYACIVGSWLAFCLPEQLELVDADPVRVAQVVNNLLDNACKFTPSGRRVSVSVGQESGEAVINVADTGIGMSREQLPRIFEVFTQVEDAPGDRTGGLGIGLSLAQSIMELHGGTIEAHSEGPERGSKFALRLPVSDSDAPGDDVAETGEAEVGQPVLKRIIAADDNLDTLHAVALLLRMKGHEVETAVDGVDALKKVQAHPGEGFLPGRATAR